MRNIISSQLEIGQVDIANIVIDVTSRDDIQPIILLGLQHIYTVYRRVFERSIRFKPTSAENPGNL